MNESLKLIDHLEAIGHPLSLEGENLRIMRGKHLPPSLRGEIAIHKQQILSIFKCDQEAQAAHFLIGIPGTLYIRNIGRFSSVYLEFNGESWEAWRETYQPGRTSASSFKTIVPPSSFGAAMAGLENYFRYIEQLSKRIS